MSLFFGIYTMSIRMIQGKCTSTHSRHNLTTHLVCSVWFWLALTFFVFVLIHQSHNLLPYDPLAVTHSSSISSHAPHPESTPALSTPRGLSILQRMARSEKAWQSSVALRHTMASAHPSNPRVPFFPAQQLSEFGKYPYTVWDFFPATYSCPHDIQRVGRLGDGGKWVCGMSLYEARPAPATSRIQSAKADKETVIYSFGVNDESTFEAEMLARIPSAQIYAFDFSVDGFGPQIASKYASRAHFSKVGLGPRDEEQAFVKFFTLQSLMEQNKHTYIDILKIDIEGGEYEALDSFMDAFVKEEKLPVGQVMIELHLIDDKNVDFERFSKWWERLEGFGMRPTWLEINLLAVTLGAGKTDPRCVEYVWVNVKDDKSILLQE